MVFNARTRFGSKAPTLGLLVDGLDDSYQGALTAGALEAVNSGGASLICFPGGILGSPLGSAEQRNHIYELASHHALDGLVVLSGTIVNHVGPEALAEFCERFRPLPMCCIAAPLPSMPAVLVDNEGGMRSIIEHFVVAHAAKRIAFVRGPLANDEAGHRYQIYCDTLTAHGLSVDERLVAIGNFQAESGRAAVGTWLDERGLSIADIDAIVASNDNMALGVLEELRARRLRVPEDVAVAGFDDVEEARYTNPSLTTVRQPLEAQGREAVRLVIEAIQHGKQPSESVCLSTDLVIRGSCGCFGTSSGEASPAADGSGFSFEAALLGKRQLICAAMTRAARGNLANAGNDWEGQLLAWIVTALRGESCPDLRRFFESASETLIDRGDDPKPVHDVLSTLRSELLPCLTKEPQLRTNAEDLFDGLRQAVSSSVERSLGRSRLMTEHWARQLSAVGASLIGTFDVDALSSSIAAHLPTLGIRATFVSVYEDSNSPPRSSKLLLSYDLLGKLPDPKSDSFPSLELLPEEFLESSDNTRAFVLAPLFFRDEVLGNLLIELDITHAFAYESIRELVSSALKGSFLVRAVRDCHSEREAAVNELGTLRESYSETLLALRKALQNDVVDKEQLLALLDEI